MKLKSTIPWLFFILIAAAFIFPVVALMDAHLPVSASWAELLLPVVPVTFAFVGALIVSRQPGNVIGWLLMLPGASIFALTDFYFRPFNLGYAPLPVSPSALFLLLLWFSSWNWLLLVFPIMFIMLLFPTGRPLSQRWGWLVYVGILLALSLPVSATVSQTLATASGEAVWSYPNPIGFLSAERANTFLTPFLFAFPVWIVLCAISLFVRFRRSRAVEREQIKWLFFAAAVFTICYLPVFFGNNFTNAADLWNLFFILGLIVFPVAIGMAILKYRLFDIEIIIRRTLVYTLLTALLTMVYFGGVTLLQSLFTTASGQASPAALVISTLLISALFNPLRLRIQNFIDRRFYRRKYNAEKALAEFATAARSETNLETLSEQLVQIVDSTMQVRWLNLWLQPGTNEERLQLRNRAHFPPQAEQEDLQ